jgi:hypothetical protein
MRVCVWEKEREREREGGSQIQKTKSREDNEKVNEQWKIGRRGANDG